VAVVAGGLCRDDRFRVWDKVVEGAKRVVVSKAMAIGFKLFLLLFCQIKLRPSFEAVIVPETNGAARMTRKARNLVA
jgi:hypothetical protein